MMAEYIERDAAIREIISDMALFLGDPNAVQRHDEQCNYAISYFENAPAADVAPVRHGNPVMKMHTVTLTGYHEEIGKFATDGANLYRKKMIHADIPYYHCPACGATLCSRWHNYCGKCGAKMDGGVDDEAD